MTNQEQDLDPDHDEDFDEDYVPRILVIGAGPIGLEAALYARYLGYEVAVIEQGTVADSVLRWGHVRMFSPFSMNSSALGVAALRAQHEDAELPEPDAILTGREYAEAYLLPLSRSDLLRGCVMQQVKVLSVGRDGILKTDVRDVDRSDFRFRVLVETPAGEDVIDADVVLDTTGVTGQQNFVGHGGMPAIGELVSRAHFSQPLPDILGADRERFANRRVLVVGSGYSAATNIVALDQLKSDAPDTQVTWITRRECPETGPLPISEDDRLPRRSELAQGANNASHDHFDQTAVISVAFDPLTHEFTVSFGGKLTGERTFDQIIPNVGFRPDTEIFGELQMAVCPASQAPLKTAEWIAAAGAIDALDQVAPGAHVLTNPEPNFYVLGSKSFGRNSNFLLAVGLMQIRDVFTVIADREDLDLYATMEKLAG